MGKQEGRKGRGKSPTQPVKQMLYVSAGGRCQFPGCNKHLLLEKASWRYINSGEVAHIVGASENGPRGNSKSHELSQELDNLMLLCPEHHKLIDDNPDKYTVEYMSAIKEEQEKKVKFLLDGMNYPVTKFIVLESPIKGRYKTKVEKNAVIKAICSHKKRAEDQYGISIEIPAIGDYKSDLYWEFAENELKKAINTKVDVIYSDTPGLILSVFPIAPIPLIAKLGELLGDKKTVDIYQKTRIPDTWEWQSNKITNTFTTERIVLSEGKNVAIILSLTAAIDLQRVTDVFEADIIYHVKADRIEVDSIKSESDLMLFSKEVMAVCDNIKNGDNVKEVSVFPAIPVSAAFEIGRRHMPRAHPILHIYDEDEGFFKTLSIGG